MREDTIKYFTQEELKRLFKTIENSKDKHSLRNYLILELRTDVDSVPLI